MSRILNMRSSARGAILLAAAAVSVGLPASSSARRAEVPRVATGGVKHVRGTSGQLDAVINPDGVETSYYFEYGPNVPPVLTGTYAHSTKPEPIGKGTRAVRVGQSVSGLLPGYHYRVVAVYGPPGTKPVLGKDKSFLGGNAGKLRFQIPRGKENEITVTYGGTAELSGGLTGLGNTSHGLILQADPYPYKAAFTTVLLPIRTSLSGHFVFRVPNVMQNTEYRILTTDSRPLYSAVTTVHVTPKIILHIRPAGGKGQYRIYGTLAPAKLRGTLLIQELKPQKATSKREGPRAHTIGSVPIKRGTSTHAKFSTVLTLSGTNSYRVYLKLPKGVLDSGASNTVQVHAPKLATGKHSKRKARTKHARGKGKHAGKKKK